MMKYKRAFFIVIGSTFDEVLTMLDQKIASSFWDGVDQFVQELSLEIGLPIQLFAYGEVHPGLDLWPDVGVVHPNTDLWPGVFVFEPHQAFAIALKTNPDMDDWWSKHSFTERCCGKVCGLSIRLVRSAIRGIVFEHQSGASSLLFFERLLHTILEDRPAWWFGTPDTKWGAMSQARHAKNFLAIEKLLADSCYSDLGKAIVAAAIFHGPLWNYEN